MKRKYEYRALCTWLLVSGIVFGSFAAMGSIAFAAPVPDIKIATVYPLSGGFSRNGNLTLQSIKAAMGWVNEKGGIKSLGGAKLVPVIGDSGASLEGAASAMERVCRDPDITIAMGSWSSSFTMASTEVTERLGIPHFSISYSDKLNGRGFKWGFYVATPASGQVEVAMPKLVELARSSGQVVKTAMYVGTNTAGNLSYYSAAKKIFGNMGIKLIAEEMWSAGTLTDATSVMQKVKTTNPDLVLFAATAIAEAHMCLMKKKELAIKSPFIALGGYAGDTSFAPIGAEVLEGLVAISGSFAHKLTPKEWINRTLEQCRKEYGNEPWIGQELSFGWLLVPTVAEILERVGSRDRKAIRDMAAEIDIHDIMATRQSPMQGIAFGQDQRLAKKYWGTLFVQWQGGVPYTIYPPNLAVNKPKWVAK